MHWYKGTQLKRIESFERVVPESKRLIPLEEVLVLFDPLLPTRLMSDGIGAVLLTWTECSHAKLDIEAAKHVERAKIQSLRVYGGIVYLVGGHAALLDESAQSLWYYYSSYL